MRSKLRRELVDAGIRVKMDEREGMSPGFKFNDWEMRGVPLRLELGPKDVAKGSVVLARRDRPGKEGKTFVPQQGIAGGRDASARGDSEGALRPGARFPQSQHGRAGRLRGVQEGGREGIRLLLVVRRRDCEEKIKEETKATMRCIPLEQPGGSGNCVYCAQPASERPSSRVPTRPPGSASAGPAAPAFTHRKHMPPATTTGSAFPVLAFNTAPPYESHSPFGGRRCRHGNSRVDRITELGGSKANRPRCDARHPGSDGLHGHKGRPGVLRETTSSRMPSRANPASRSPATPRKAWMTFATMYGARLQDLGVPADENAIQVAVANGSVDRSGSTTRCRLICPPIKFTLQFHPHADNHTI